jgi:LuxR family transcriptional regulator, quorum-sensing system regulator BjaR1
VSGRGLDLAQEAFGFIESLDDLQTGRAVLAAMDRAFALFGFENFRLVGPLTINTSTII